MNWQLKLKWLSAKTAAAGRNTFITFNRFAYNMSVDHSVSRVVGTKERKQRCAKIECKCKNEVHECATMMEKNGTGPFHSEGGAEGNESVIINNKNKKKCRINYYWTYENALPPHPGCTADTAAVLPQSAQIENGSDCLFSFFFFKRLR